MWDVLVLGVGAQSAGEATETGVGWTHHGKAANGATAVPRRRESDVSEHPATPSPLIRLRA